MAQANSGGGGSGARTRKSLRLPRLHPLLGLGLALASALVLVYGIWLQPPGYHGAGSSTRSRPSSSAS